VKSTNSEEKKGKNCNKSRRDGSGSAEEGGRKRKVNIAAGTSEAPREKLKKGARQKKRGTGPYYRKRSDQTWVKEKATHSEGKRAKPQTAHQMPA